MIFITKISLYHTWQFITFTVTTLVFSYSFSVSFWV